MQSQLLQEDWAAHLRTLAKGVSEDLVVCTPSIDREGARLLIDNVESDRRTEMSLRILTDLSPVRIYGAKTEPRALLDLADVFQHTEVRHLPSVHANAYVSDMDAAIVGSGTLTRRGLYVNYEYAIQVLDVESIVDIRNDLLSYASLGSLITRHVLADLVSLTKRLHEHAGSTRGLSAAARSQLESLLSQAEDTLILPRIQRGTPHATFAETLGYILLKHGAMKTTDIHVLIQGIHPDLCNDSIERVIAGHVYGKKWKHQVRSAQAHLKRAALADHNAGVWRLTERGRKHFSKNHRRADE